MAGDYSRASFSALKDFVGVLLQQGHPVTDADWNEFAGIVERPLHLPHRQRTEGVAHLGAVYGDLRDPLRLVVFDVLELSSYFPGYVSHGEDYRCSEDSCIQQGSPALRASSLLGILVQHSVHSLFVRACFCARLYGSSEAG